MNTKFFGITNRNKFLNELEKVLKEKFPDKKDVDEIINSIGQANGIASLDGSGKVPSEQLPSYVDDIIEVEDYAHLPEVGETGKIYITLDTGNQYRWGGSEYVPLNENSIQGIGVKKIIELTQAEYDALTEKDANTIYIIKTFADIANGHEYVDLGLIDEEGNKIMFSPYNLGANSPEQPGDYYAWGEIEANKDSYTWENYKWCNGTYDSLTKYNAADNKIRLDIEDDAASVKLGGLWHIPTKIELDTFIEKCSFLWTTQNNKTGFLVTGINKSTIFIPSSGFKYNTQEDEINDVPRIWSSDKYDTDSNANSIMKNNTNKPRITGFNRQYGLCIRPALTIPKDYTPEVTGYKLYKGSILIASSEDTNRINNLEDKVTELESTTTNKADKPVSPTEGHLVKVNSLGALLDAGLAIVKMTKAEYNALVTKDPLTVYLVDASLQNGVYVAYTDGSLSNYDVLDAGKTPIGPLLKTSNVCLIVHPDDVTGKSWATGTGVIPNVFTTTDKAVAATDFSGESNTLAVIASQKQGTAFDFATQAVYADGRIGHLPSYGEMVDICDNVSNINTVLTLMGGAPIVYSTSRNYWTSTQNNSENSWYYMMNWPSSDKKTNAYEGRYCRSVSNYNDSRIILYLGSILIADSSLPSKIASILATI